MMTRLSPFLLAPVLAALLLSACAAPEPVVTEPPSVQVMRQPMRLRLIVDRAGTVQSAYGDLNGFLARWRDEGSGPLVVETPYLPDAARTRLWYDLEGRLRRIGADAGAIDMGLPGSGGDGVWLRFDRAVAVLPDCGPEERGYGQSANNPGPAFGCATRRNLGAIVANPADLDEPRLDGAVNAARGAAVIGKYRRGPAATGNGNGNGTGKANGSSGFAAATGG